MMKPDLKTPGVYIQEVNAFPNQIVGIPTAVPAFIGYTAQANLQGKSVVNQPFKIQSLNEFEAVFGKGPTPQYYLQLVPQKPKGVNFLTIANQYYLLLPDPGSCYYLYNSIRLFYMNGGNEAYIVSVGAYGRASGKPIGSGAPLLNPNVRLSDLLTGLATLQREQEPTLYLCPDASLLSKNDNGALMQAMLNQCGNLQTAMSLLDVQDGRNPDPVDFMLGINTFRDQVGVNGLKYGAAYYPFVHTAVCPVDEINYTNLFGGDIQPLVPMLCPKTAPDPATAKILADIKAGTKTPVVQMNRALMATSAGYRLIMQSVLSEVNLLPPACAIAGIITMVDNTLGVWKAPANVSVNGAISLPINLSDLQQQNLNVDAITGKSINAIRNFADKAYLYGAPVLWMATARTGVISACAEPSPGLNNPANWRYSRLYLNPTTKTPGKR
jgi:phage tail sheath protein FI